MHSGTHDALGYVIYGSTNLLEFYNNYQLSLTMYNIYIYIYICIYIYIYVNRWFGSLLFALYVYLNLDHVIKVSVYTVFLTVKLSF